MTFRRRLLEFLAVKHADKPMGPGHPVEQLKSLDPPPVQAAEPRNYRMALAAMADPVFLRSERYQEQQWRAVREGGHPDIIEFERVFIKRLRAVDVPLFAHSLVRSSSDQDALLAQGVTKAGAGESPHNFGMAVDIVHGTRAWDLTRMQWEVLGHLGKETAVQLGIKIEWGGEWKFYDPAHWELANWQEIRDSYRSE